MTPPRRWLLAACFLFLLAGSGCEPLAQHRLRGTYYRTETPDAPFPALVSQLTLTDTKCIMALPMAGQVAQDYRVEDDVIYVGGAEGQICFTIERAGVIRNQGTLGLEGTYVRRDKSRPGE